MWSPLYLIVENPVSSHVSIPFKCHPVCCAPPSIHVAPFLPMQSNPKRPGVPQSPKPASFPEKTPAAVVFFYGALFQLFGKLVAPSPQCHRGLGARPFRCPPAARPPPANPPPPPSHRTCKGGAPRLLYPPLLTVAQLPGGPPTSHVHPWWRPTCPHGSRRPSSHECSCGRRCRVPPCFPGGAPARRYGDSRLLHANGGEGRFSRRAWRGRQLRTRGGPRHRRPCSCAFPRTEIIEHLPGRAARMRAAPRQTAQRGGCRGVRDLRGRRHRPRCYG